MLNIHELEMLFPRKYQLFIVGSQVCGPQSCEPAIISDAKQKE